MNDRHARGQSMVEFALLLPLLLLVILGILAFGLIFHSQSTVTLAVAAGVRKGVTLDYPGQSQTDHYNAPIVQAIGDSMTWLGKSSIEIITIYQPKSDGSVPADADTSYKKDVLDKNGNQKSGRRYDFTNSYRVTDTGLGVEVEYHQQVWLPLINPITGNEIIFKVSESRRIE